MHAHLVFRKSYVLWKKGRQKGSPFYGSPYSQLICSFMIILRRLKSTYLPQVLCFCHGAQRSSTYYASFTTNPGQIPHLTTLYKLPYSKDMTGSRSFCRDSSTTSLQGALEGNRRWAQEQTQRDPTFFNALAQQQRPQWLWIGCSDSRVPVSSMIRLPIV